jgi:hypothetical protein
VKFPPMGINRLPQFFTPVFRKNWGNVCKTFFTYPKTGVIFTKKLG